MVCAGGGGPPGLACDVMQRRRPAVDPRNSHRVTKDTLALHARFYTKPDIFFHFSPCHPIPMISERIHDAPL